MTSVPRDKDGKIEFFEERLPQWVVDPASIGLTADQVTALAALVDAARAAYTAAQQGKQELKNLVATQDLSIQEMMQLGTALLATIHAYADATGATDGDMAANDIYNQAGISAFNNPAPLAPPVPASNLQATLLNSGGLKLTWDGTVANGTVYSVWRKTQEETSFSQIATSGRRLYEDQTLPAGSMEVSYFLKTHRDDLVSDDSETITVRLGVTLGTGSGSETETTDLGLAA